MKHLLIISLFANIACSIQAQIITTIAGNGTPGYNGDNISAVTAQLNGSYHLFLDSSGNMFIGDFANHRIRKISTDGIITTIAGNGTGGYTGDGGIATDAQLYYPEGVVIDDTGNIYFSDDGNMVVRKVDINGIITTIAGNHIGGYTGDGGPATEAELNHPSGLCLTSSGDILIADTYNNVIRKVDKNGIITTIAGNGIQGYGGDGEAATSAELNWPYGVVLDKQGNLLFGDTQNNRIRKVDKNGIITTIAGTGNPGYSGDGGVATAAELFGPIDLAFNSAGDIFFTDLSNNVIRKITSDGIISTYAGNGTQGFSGDDGLATEAQLYHPFGILVDSSGNIFFTDRENNRIRKITPGTMPITLLQFTATGGNKQIVCKWETATEINSSHFNIQRSEDAIHFSTIGKVTAAGNSNTTNNYNYTDFGISALGVSKIYYRLQCVDKDGSSVFSSISTVNLASFPEIISAWPNPVKDKLHVEIKNYSGKVMLSLFDIFGNKLHIANQTITGSGKFTINTNFLQSGTYIISININGKTVEKKIVKE